MCLAIPMRIERIEENVGTCELGGVRYNIRLDLIERPAVGEYVLAHAGVAIKKVDEREVEELAKLYRELEESGGWPGPEKSEPEGGPAS